MVSWLLCLCSVKQYRFWPWPGKLCCVLGKRHFTLTMPLSTQVYKWVAANLMLGEGVPCNGLPGGSRNAPSPFML